MTPCALGRNFLSQPGGIVRQMLPRSRNMMGGGPANERLVFVGLIAIRVAVLQASRLQPKGSGRSSMNSANWRKWEDVRA